MDYQTKKSYKTLIASALVLVGFFVLIWNHEAIIKNAPTQSAQLIDAVLGGNTDAQQNDQLFPLLVQYLREQQDTIAILQTENTTLREALALVGTSSTSTIDGTESAVIAPKKILLVAGHTAQTKGAQYGAVTEYELNYNILKKLESEMKKRGYDVTVTHSGGDYTGMFLDYFESNESRIMSFRQNRKSAYDSQYPQGVVTNDTDHNYASDLGVLQLYGVNLWANENNMDIVVHVHFNDYPGRPAGQRGIHSGFSIFTPLKTNNHFVESFKLAKAIEENMLKYAKRSTVTNESAGVLESELIAVGQANSTDMPSVLIENGFVYESQFTDLSRREGTLSIKARTIANGIEQYFANKSN